MSALEREIIEKFHQLDTFSKQRVLESLSHDTWSSFNYEGWWAEVEALQTRIRAQLGTQGTVGALSMLDELREEAP